MTLDEAVRLIVWLADGLQDEGGIDLVPILSNDKSRRLRSDLHRALRVLLAERDALQASEGVLMAKLETAEARLREVEDMRDTWADAVEGEGGWRAERDALREALRHLLTAVTFGPESDLPNGAGRGYMARVPSGFVETARAVLAKAEGS